MASATNPFEIARETLRQLATRRVAPTPDNYLRLYYEIAGSEAVEVYPLAFVRDLARRIPRDSPERLRLARQLDQTLTADDANPVREALDGYIDCLRLEPPPAWNELITQLLRQWEGRQLGWTTARKRESLERVLTANDPATLHARLQSLLRAWGQSPIDPEQSLPPETPELAAGRDHLLAAAPTDSVIGVRLLASGESKELMTGLRDLLLLALETVIPAFLGEYPELINDAGLIAADVRRAASERDLANVRRQLAKFSHRLEGTAADAAEIRTGLLDLLRLLLDNIDELVVDDQWLHGQIEMLRDVIDQPATLRMIDDAERRLKELIYKQSQLKHNLAEAQRNLRNMLAGFVDQLARFAESTGSYHDRIGQCAQKIAAARDIGEISDVLDEVMRDTRAIQVETARSRDDLQDARLRAEAAEAKIAAMQSELEEASRLMRHDQLTGVANRRGLEESFVKEAARAERRGVPLCVALLDVDNFKQLNDTLGHQAGDDALRHLSSVVQRQLRPQDTLARYGGEEFVIILPETELPQASQALVRLQRELTRELFMNGAEQRVITFSAGVTQVLPGENLDVALGRADSAMYQAKQSGKNRVATLEPPAQLR